MQAAYCCPAPAKLNLFLHVTGRRADGYHLLQSVFRLIDLCDLLYFEKRNDGLIQRVGGNDDIPAEQDLIIRAAKLLQQKTKTNMGADIRIEKKIPMGGGLGGGSSNAATTLIVLNRLWNTGLNRQQLMDLGIQLGADVPFFLFAKNAFVEGIGEQLQGVDLPMNDYAVLFPAVNIPTPIIFNAQELTRNTERVKMSDFLATVRSGAEFGRNDLQPVAEHFFPEVATSIKWFENWASAIAGKVGIARMTGSGACVYSSFRSGALDTICTPANLPNDGKLMFAKGLNVHPLLDWVDE